MTHRVVLILTLLLVGCGGNDFHTLFSQTGDPAEGGGSGAETGIGGADGVRPSERPSAGGMAETDAGAVEGTGGSSSGGAASLATGGHPSGTGGATMTCTADQKLCGGTCLSYVDATPSIGCWEASCAPCAPPPAHAHTKCTNGQCDFDCDEGYQRSADRCIAACAEVTHNDGLGQMWSDCAPLGTFNQDQAEKACEAWCAVNGACHCEIGTFCGDSNPRIYAPWRSSFLTWVWQGNAGNVVQADPGSAGQPACTVVSNWQ